MDRGESAPADGGDSGPADAVLRGERVAAEEYACGYFAPPGSHRCGEAPKTWRHPRGVPRGLPYGAIFAKRGFLPVEVLPLYRSLAGEWLRAALAAKELSGAATVAVCGDRLTGELVRTVTELCLRYRYVLLDIPDGGEELARQLRREFGVSLILRPAAGQIAAADGVLLFTPRPELRGGVVLALYDGTEVPKDVTLTLPALEDRLPVGCCREQLLAALCGAGVLRAAQIEMKVD